MSDVSDSEAGRASSWSSSASEFVSARIELLSLEAREAGKATARRGVLAGVIVGCAVAAWITGLAGLIGWIAAAGGFPWYFVALGAAVVHLVIAGIVGIVLRRPSPPAFPLTKAELSKDREWLQNLKKKP